MITMLELKNFQLSAEVQGLMLLRAKITKINYIYTHNHYENKLIQIYWKFYHQKKSDKNSDIFHISAQNIDCGYSLEAPRQGGSNE